MKRDWMVMGGLMFLAPDGEPAGSSDGAQAQKATPEDPSKSEEAGGEGAKAPEGAPAGNAVPSWMSQLPDSLKTDEAFAKYDSFADFAKAAKESMARETQGQKDGSRKEAPQAVAPVKYADFGKKLDEETDPLGTQSEFLAKKLESMGVSQKDAEAFFDAYQDNSKEMAKKFSEQGGQWCEQKMRHDWGDQYKARKNLMDRTLKALGDNDGKLTAMLKNTGSLMNPAVWETLSRVGSLLADDTVAFSAETAAGKGRNPFAPVDYPAE